MRLLKAVNNWNTQRAAREALSGFTSRQLEDIGLSRQGTPFEAKKSI